MPSPHSLRRLANLTKQVHDDLRRGGMAMTFKYLFRSTAILARVTAILADYVATEAGAPPEEGWEPPGGRGLKVDANGEPESAEGTKSAEGTGSDDGAGDDESSSSPS